MGISTAFSLLVFVTCKIILSASTWDELMQDHDGFDNAMSITVPLDSAQDGYLHNILIGSNSQKFAVMVTMSSSMLWVPKTGCKGVGSRKTYSPSATFERDGRNWTQKSYGGTINGELGKDLVTIRGSASQQLQQKCTFGMATTISGEVKLSTDGVLGLARITDSTTPGQPFIAQIKDLLSSHMFTIFLSQPSGSNAGFVTYGSRNAGNCQTTSTLQPFTDSYHFKISSVSLGNFSHTFRNNAMPELISSITGPQADITGLAKAAGAKQNLGYYEVSCNATIPKLEIKAERFTYSIQSNRLVVKIGNRCTLALAPQTGTGFGPQWHFGAPLLQEYCITFNLDTNNLEFFGVKSVPTTTSSTRRTTSTPKRNTTSTAKTTRRIISTTPKRNITTSSTRRTTRRIPTTTPKKISTSTRKTTRRIPTTTPKKISTSTRRTTRRILSTTPRRNITTTRRFTTMRTTTKKLAPNAYLYCFNSFLLFSIFFIL